jgi:hypothetical protein
VITRGKRKLPTPPPPSDDSGGEEGGDELESLELPNHSSDDLATYSDEP